MGDFFFFLLSIVSTELALVIVQIQNIGSKLGMRFISCAILNNELIILFYKVNQVEDDCGFY